MQPLHAVGPEIMVLTLFAVGDEREPVVSKCSIVFRSACSLKKI